MIYAVISDTITSPIFGSYRLDRNILGSTRAQPSPQRDKNNQYTWK
nr:MAG TPA: hypothetical protein [Caudoviricetes sp.]